MRDIISVVENEKGNSAIDSPSNEKYNVSQLIPFQLRQKAEKMITFLSDYYDHINQNGLPSKNIADIVSEHDIDQTSSEFLDSIQAEIAANIPNSQVLDRVSLYKKIVQYYNIKGSQESVSVFFRLFYDEIVKVTYPKERLMKLSAGNWQQFEPPFSIIVKANLVNGKVNQNSINDELTLFDSFNNKLGDSKLINLIDINDQFNTNINNTNLQLAWNSQSNHITVNSNDQITNWEEKDDEANLTNNETSNKFPLYDTKQESLIFDGKNDYLISPALSGNGQISNPNISNEHTVVCRCNRSNNSTGEDKQALFSWTTDNFPYYGLELYLDRSSGRLGKRIIQKESEIAINFISNGSISLFNFDNVFHYNTTWYKIPNEDIYVQNVDLFSQTLSELLSSSKENVIYFDHNDSKWKIYSYFYNIVTHFSEVTTDPVWKAGLNWTINFFPQNLLFHQKEFSFEKEIYSDENVLFHHINPHTLLIYEKDFVFNQWILQNRIQEDTPFVSFDYNSITRQIFIGLYIENKVRVYKLNSFNEPLIQSEILADNSQKPFFGATVYSEKNKIFVGRFNFSKNSTENIGNSNIYEYPINSLSYTNLFNHSYYSASFYSASENSIGLLSLKENNNLFLSYDNEEVELANDIPFSDVSFAENNTLLTTHQNSLKLWAKKSDGFWKTNNSTDTSQVNIEVFYENSGSSETIGWAENNETFISESLSTGGILLTKNYIGAIQNVSGVENWQEFNLTNQISSLIGLSKETNLSVTQNLNGNSFFLSIPSESKIEKYDIQLTNPNVNLTSLSITKISSQEKTDTEFFGQKIYLDHNTDTLFSTGYNNGSGLFFINNTNTLFSSENIFEISTTFANSNISQSDTFVWTSNNFLPVTENSEWNTIAAFYKRDSLNGFISISVNGSARETIFSGNTTKILNLIPNQDLYIGQNGSDENYFFGRMTNFYYFDQILTSLELSNLIEFYTGLNNDWYQLELNLNDTFSKNTSDIASIVEKTESYEFLNVSDFKQQPFWITKQKDPQDGFSATFNLKYENTLSNVQQIDWGDSILQNIFLKNTNTLVHNYKGKIIGKYANSKGFLSHIHKLHDGERWQEYSYIINPSISLNEWEKEYLSLVHPAGMKFISAILLLLIRDNKWDGPNITFDSNKKKYEWNKPNSDMVGPYQSINQKTNLQWLKDLIPPILKDTIVPEHGYHFPLVQPGGLETLAILTLEFGSDDFGSITGLFPNGANSSDLTRITKMILKLWQIEKNSRDERVRDDYLQNIKFLDHGPISNNAEFLISDSLDPFIETNYNLRLSNIDSIIEKS